VQKFLLCRVTKLKKKRAQFGFVIGLWAKDRRQIEKKSKSLANVHAAQNGQMGESRTSA
jgi:hypothetical protein